MPLKKRQGWVLHPHLCKRGRSHTTAVTNKKPCCLIWPHGNKAPIYLGCIWKLMMWPAARDFCVAQDIFSQEYWRISRKNDAAHRKKARCPGALGVFRYTLDKCWIFRLRSWQGTGQISEDLTYSDQADITVTDSRGFSPHSTCKHMAYANYPIFIFYHYNIEIRNY